MFDEDELRPISALQHLIFCERQCALIHIEGLWAENRLTTEGRHLHGRAHNPARASVKYDAGSRVRVRRGVPLRSLRLGLIGVADVVELHESPIAGGAPQPLPVEYKRGRSKRIDCDRIQLCAQALCLEEILNAEVPAGALFYGATRRRETITFDQKLRQKTIAAIDQLHELLSRNETPPAKFMPKCKCCSLLHLCMPTVSHHRSALRYLKSALKHPELDDPQAHVPNGCES